MSTRDLRDHIDFLDEHDLLRTVTGADWDLEIGGLTELAVNDQSPVGLLFNDITDYPTGFRVLTNACSSPFTWSAALGLTPTPSKRELVLRQKERSIESIESYPPETSSSGPVCENVLSGGDVDVEKFPAPKWNVNDGGRYIGTADVVVTRDPVTGEINAGTYRVQVQGPDQVTAYISPGKDGRTNREAYLDSGDPCPMAISVGHPPDLYFGTQERLPSTVNEFAYVGGRRGEPIEVIEGEVTGLPIPAHSEIVLEGHIYPDTEPITEGPFGEWTGYYAGGEHDELPLQVERIYHRDDPIILGVQLVRPPSQVRSEIKTASRLWSELDNAGIPGITAVNSMPFGPGWFEVISISQQYGGHSSQVGQHAASGPADAYHGRFTVVVDDDIDVFDQDEVLWAICSRCDPATDIHILENCWSTSLDPAIPPKRKSKGDLTNSRAIIDATRPYHWRDQFPETVGRSKAAKEELRSKWSDLFTDIERPRELDENTTLNM